MSAVSGLALCGSVRWAEGPRLKSAKWVTQQKGKAVDSLLLWQYRHQAIQCTLYKEQSNQWEWPGYDGQQLQTCRFKRADFRDILSTILSQFRSLMVCQLTLIAISPGSRTQEIRRKTVQYTTSETQRSNFDNYEYRRLKGHRLLNNYKKI